MQLQTGYKIRMKHTVYLRLRPPFGQEALENSLEIVRVEEEETILSQEGHLNIRVTYVYGYNLKRLRGISTNCSASFDLYSYKGSSGSATLVNGAFFIDPDALMGRGIGTFILNRFVVWLKKQAPAAEVQPIELLYHQARGDGEQPNHDNIARREKVYENIGLEFEKWPVEGINNAAGKSKQIIVQNLKNVSEDRLLKEIDLVDELNNVTAERKELEAKYNSILLLNNDMNRKLLELEFTGKRWKTISKYLLFFIVIMLFLLGIRFR